MSLSSADVSRVPALDGLRGVAILTVVIFHFLQAPGPSTIERLIFKAVSAGWLGVDLFFVLSGFLITGILLDTKGSEHYFRNFYVRRILRILPLYYGVLLVAAVFVPALTRGGYRVFQPGEQLWYWAHISNWGWIWRIDAYPLTHFWSLAIEEQFYLVWPCVVFLCSRRTLAYISIGLIAAGPVLRSVLIFAFDSGTQLPYRLTPTRLDSLALGALIVLAAQSPVWLPRALAIARKTSPVCLALLGCTAVLARGLEVDKEPAVIFAPVLGGALFAHAVLAAGTGHLPDSISRWLTGRLLLDFGKYSYAIYIFHWPLQLVLAHYLGSMTNGSHFLLRIGWNVSYLLLGTTLSYVLARVSWWMLEEPCLRWKSVLAPRPERTPMRQAAAAATVAR